jgi:hypothetical protein
MKVLPELAFANDVNRTAIVDIPRNQASHVDSIRGLNVVASVPPRTGSPGLSDRKSAAAD